ncbi:MAG: hypothetical protein EOP21_00335 [Hyphomicrobiales bacterium]|nr:MAG: hypothetical protein EOP21_00335 [Hyphomicrobiales bacterium]
MSDSFVVEANHRTVGVAVRGPGGYKFYASDAAFRPLEQMTFRRARTLAHKVGEFAQRLMHLGAVTKPMLH